MPKRSFRIALVIVLSTIVILTVVAIYFVNRALEYPTERNQGDGSEVAVTIDRGMTFPKIATRLHKKGLLERPVWFRLYAMHRGVTTKVRPGNYVLTNKMTPEELLDRLLEGVKQVTVQVTIPEGLHYPEVFALFEEKGIAKADALEALAWDREFLDGLGIDGDTVEGFLFPETYSFVVPTEPKKVIQRLVRQHRTVWQEIRKRQSRSIGKLRDRLEWTDREFLIMASIVEKEAVLKSEQARIAQVFVNRLTDPNFRPRKLQTDPTIRYGCVLQKAAEKRFKRPQSPGCKKWDTSKRLRRAQLDDKDNPYNTYQIEGLPPGPICSPGRGAMEATANPDGSKYFFFVARADQNGAHVFSRTRAQHEKAVRDYVKSQ